MVPKRKGWFTQPFIVADKFNDNTISSTQKENNLVAYLCAINKEKDDLLEQRMGVLDQKVMYGTLHGAYKKALQKALRNKSNSLCLIGILEEFANEDSECEDNESDELVLNEESDGFESDKENVFQLQNPKR